MKDIQSGDIVVCSAKYGSAHQGEALKAESRWEDLDHRSGWYWSCESQYGGVISIPETLLRSVTLSGIEEAWQQWHEGYSTFLNLIAEFGKRSPEEEIAALERSQAVELVRIEKNFAESKQHTLEYYGEQIEKLRATTV